MTKNLKTENFGLKSKILRLKGAFSMTFLASYFFLSDGGFTESYWDLHDLSKIFLRLGRPLKSTNNDGSILERSKIPSVVFDRTSVKI